MNPYDQTPDSRVTMSGHSDARRKRALYKDLDTDGESAAIVMTGKRHQKCRYPERYYRGTDEMTRIGNALEGIPNNKLSTVCSDGELRHGKRDDSRYKIDSMVRVGGDVDLQTALSP